MNIASLHTTIQALGLKGGKMEACWVVFNSIVTLDDFCSLDDGAPTGLAPPTGNVLHGSFHGSIFTGSCTLARHTRLLLGIVQESHVGAVTGIGTVTRHRFRSVDDFCLETSLFSRTFDYRAILDNATVTSLYSLTVHVGRGARKINIKYHQLFCSVYSIDCDATGVRGG
jgi:hypothetical protein